MDSRVWDRADLQSTLQDHAAVTIIVLLVDHDSNRLLENGDLVRVVRVQLSVPGGVGRVVLALTGLFAISHLCFC